MKSKMMITAMVLFFSAPILQAETGKSLYAKNCTACHGTEVFTRDNRRVKDMAGLKSRVKQCSYAVESSWFDDEVNAVANYLNTSFYQF